MMVCSTHNPCSYALLSKAQKRCEKKKDFSKLCANSKHRSMNYVKFNASTRMFTSVCYFRKYVVDLHTYKHILKRVIVNFLSQNKVLIWRAKAYFGFHFIFHHVSNAAIKYVPLKCQTKMRNLVPFIIIIIVIVVVVIFIVAWNVVCAYNKIQMLCYLKLSFRSFFIVVLEFHEEEKKNSYRTKLCRNTFRSKYSPVTKTMLKYVCCVRVSKIEVNKDASKKKKERKKPKLAPNRNTIVEIGCQRKYSLVTIISQPKSSEF